MDSALKLNTDWDVLVKEVSEVITKITGNVMEDKQRPMIESRLKRRCLDLKMSSPIEYKQFWKRHQDQENKILIGLLTTHFTSFFREFSHFEWLANELPAIVQNVRKEGRKTITIWSAASSKGQEIWSLCMWLQHYLPKIDPFMDFHVLGSDIDSVSVKEAENGVYHRRELETAPRHLWEGHWVRGTGEISDWYKIKSDMRKHASFKVMNLLDISLSKDQAFDIILCRNVLIYFDRKNQEKIVLSLLKHLSPMGTLITGLSESLGGYGLPVKGVAPSVYKLQSAPVIELPKKVQPQVETLPVPLKVFCVDDSATILNILKKILKAPQFEVIGTASNGLDALEKLKVLKPDVITLDIHMPEMDGPTFLKTSGVAYRTPVIVVSSVGRDHEPLISPMKSLGVVDFVEKPTLTNITEIGEELVQKIKMGWLNRKNVASSKSVVTSDTQSKKRPSGMVVFNFGSGDELRLLRVLDEHDWESDHLVFRFNGASFPVSFKERIQLPLKRAAKIDLVSLNERTPFSSAPVVWLCFRSGDFQQLKDKRKKHEFMVLEEGSPEFIVTDASDISPATSFNYLVDKFFRGE
ncbi:MAG: response regulator [Bacteriovoracaceae bacterium]|nr:response regulator [Bacteriovoracaceae bacterium]